MSTPFSPKQGLIIVSAQLWGPAGDTFAQLALDTGATLTTLSAAVLVTVGYDPAASPTRVRVTTGSGVEYVPSMVIAQIEALGQQRTNFPVLCHTLPPSAAIDGLLGLDFLRNHRLTIDFRTGRITLR
jgi:aspartyl protease family protein